MEVIGQHNIDRIHFLGQTIFLFFVGEDTTNSVLLSQLLPLFRITGDQSDELRILGALECRQNGNLGQMAQPDNRIVNLRVLSHPFNPVLGCPYSIGGIVPAQKEELF
jgi:hypothetical protein